MCLAQLGYLVHHLAMKARTDGFLWASRDLLGPILARLALGWFFRMSNGPDAGPEFLA